MWSALSFLLLIVYYLNAATSFHFSKCHDDPEYEPEEGPLFDTYAYSWFGTLQYVHVKNGTPHYFRAPRVSLISRQFALSTAQDAARVPDEYALGNVVFGDYERDERECKLTIQTLANGADCDPAVLLMPIADVLLHPEYLHFNVKFSIALLKLLRPVLSSYVVPVCLPLQPFLSSSGNLPKDQIIYHVDFSSDVPRDFIREGKEMKYLKTIPREICNHNTNVMNQSKVIKDRLMCSTSCGFRSGAASVIHEHTGHWSLLALAEGGSPCPDPLVSRQPPPPPRHLLLHPYVAWITGAISGKPSTGFAKDDPFGYVMPRTEDTEAMLIDYDTFMHGWNGHWWMGGARCYDRGENAIDLFRFYHEIFQVKPVARTLVSYYLEIDSTPDSIITCVKVGMPFRLGTPKVSELETPSVRVSIPVIYIEGWYSIQVEAFAYNASSLEMSSSHQSNDS